VANLVKILMELPINMNIVLVTQFLKLFKYFVVSL